MFVMGSLIDWAWLGKESLSLRMLQWKLRKLKSKEKKKKSEKKPE